MTSLKYILFFLIVVAALTSCSDASAPMSDLSCDESMVEDALEVIGQASTFEDLLELEQRISLEIADHSLIGQVTHIREHPAGFVIADARISNQAYLYSKEGSLISLLGSSGVGPNEYKRIEDVQVDGAGNTYVLADNPNKLLTYDATGVYLDEYSIHDLGINPSRFAILRDSPLQIAFYVLHPDFNIDFNKVAVASLEGFKFRLDQSFLPFEPTGKKLFFSGGTFYISNNLLWTHPIFELGTEVYNPFDGSLIATIPAPTSKLPKPFIEQRLFESAERARDALPAYGSSTRLFSQVELGGVLASAYTAGPDNDKYFAFHTLCGTQLDTLVQNESFPLLYRLAGSTTTGNRLFFSSEEELNSASQILVYRPKWD